MTNKKWMDFHIFPGFRQDLGEPNNTASLQLFRFDSPKKIDQPKVVVSVSPGQGAEGKLMMSPPKAIKSSKKRRMKKQKPSLKLAVRT